METKTRLNVYLAKSGLCSRRAADEAIQKGDVTINHAVMLNPGYKVQGKDTVRYKKQVIKLVVEDPVTIVLNKPTAVITTSFDDQGRRTVMDLLGKEYKNVRLYPIGRLDVNTTGVLLLTNDGELALKLAHPRFNVKKVYQVTLTRPISDVDFATIKKGLYLQDGAIKADNIELGFHADTVKVTLHSGKNRIVRRIFEALNYIIKRLDRINFAGITKRTLPLGQCRALTKTELASLKKLLAKEEKPLKAKPKLLKSKLFKAGTPEKK